MIVELNRPLAAALLGAALAIAAPALAQNATPPGMKKPIPFKQDEASGPALAARGVAVLALAALAAYGGALVLKRSGLGAKTLPGKVRRVRLVESVRLSRRSVLHVVHYRGEELLLAESEQGLRLLSSRAEGAADA